MTKQKYNEPSLVLFRNLDYKKDNNNLQDPYEDQDITPLAPISPAEVAPIGMLDGIYPKEDLDGKSVENLYYGINESHEYATDDGKIKDKKDSANKKAYWHEANMLNAEAQLIEVLELPQAHSPMEMFEHEHEESAFPELVMEMHDDHGHEAPESVEEHPEHLDLTVDELPGVKGLDPDLEKALEIVEEPKDKDKDANDAKQSKPLGKWDWEAKGAKGFVAWIKERLVDVPKHSGYDTSGLERAISYMEKLDSEISRAMRLDLDGELDADKIEEVRSQIDEGIERLHVRLDKIKKKHGTGKKRKKANDDTEELVKLAQKMPTITGIVVTVPLLISSLARVIINGMVSAGHSAEDSFDKLATKYKLTDREKQELVQHLMDMGLPVRRDRGIMLDEEYDATSSDNFDFGANYPH